MEEPEFPINEFPILDDRWLEEQARQNSFVDLPQKEHQDNRQENTQQNTNLSNQITVQAGNGMNAISQVAGTENRSVHSR